MTLHTLQSRAKKLIHFILSKRCISSCLAILALVATPLVFADNSVTSISGIQGNLGKTVTQLSIILQDIALIAGIGFVLASFFKFHQHKLNPTQVPISQGVTLLMIGSALLLLPTILPVATKAAVGTSSIAKISGKGITSLIGGSKS